MINRKIFCKSGPWFKKHLTIYHKIISSLSKDRLTTILLCAKTSQEYCELIYQHEVARCHCDRRPRHCCMSHSDELPSANALSAPQHHLSGTLSLSLFRTVTRLHYLNLDLKHICSPSSMLLNCPVRQRLWSHGNVALYKFCIVLYCNTITDDLTILQVNRTYTKSPASFLRCFEKIGRPS